MKRILFSLLALSSFWGTAQTILSEDFEGATFPSTGWTRASTVASRPWQLTSSFPTSSSGFLIAGTKSAGVDYINQNNNATLTSPAFSLAGTTNPALKFKVIVGWSYMIDQDAGNLTAQISVDGGTNWTTLWDEDTEPGFVDDGDGNEATDLYNIVSVQKNLTAYAGQANVKIRFQYIANDADAVSIDDIKVLGNGSLATHEVSSNAKEALLVYPNPTKGEINIKTDKKIKSSSVFDMTGKSLIQTDSEKTDISSLPKGTYLVKVNFADGSSSTRKVIKQ